MMLKTKPTEQKIKPRESGYSSVTYTILGTKQKSIQFKITEVMNNVVNCSEIF